MFSITLDTLFNMVYLHYELCFLFNIVILFKFVLFIRSKVPKHNILNYM